MYYSRFKNNESAALATVIFCWIASLLYSWMAVLSEIGGGVIMPSLLTFCSVLSAFWWQKSKSADKQLLENLLILSEEWRQGIVTSRITHIGGKQRPFQQLAWALNDLIDQVETAQVDMRFSLAYVTWGDFTRKSYPEGLHGGFRRALVELNRVTDMLSSLTTAISALMRALAEGDFSHADYANYAGRCR